MFTGYPANARKDILIVACKSSRVYLDTTFFFCYPGFMKLRLVDLQPEFLVIDKENARARTLDINTADGLLFLCPKCFAANSGDFHGVHSVLCWKPTVPQEQTPGPGRWEMLGTGFDDLTLRAGSSSVALQSGCMAHFFITNGQIIQSGDGGDY